MTTKTIITNKQGNVFRSPPSYFCFPFSFTPSCRRTGKRADGGTGERRQGNEGHPQVLCRREPDTEAHLVEEAPDT